jgi:DNA-directed RNA polymerase subunit alpha
MSDAIAVELKELVLSNTTFGPKEIEQIVSAIAQDFANYRHLRDALSELEQKEERSPATNTRMGVCYYLLGRYIKALEVLGQGDGGALALFYQGKSAFAVQRHPEAISFYDSAKEAGYEANACQLGKAEAQRYSGDAETALKTLDSLSGAVEQTAEYLYQRGATVAALGGNPEEVVALYERAVESDPRHPGALFGLACVNDRYGNDDEAMELYRRSTTIFPPHIGSLLNLGLLYEDHNDYERAHLCFRRILDIFPDHPRARLFQKDTMASRSMFYDEDAQKRRDKISQVLNVPVTDFELSVRSRNCLQKMGINTLGDLTSTTEQELLASKNFGETSLTEIREMLTSKGLSLGQFAHEKHQQVMAYQTENLSADEQALLSKPIADLNLSVRARKCMVRLNIATIGELIRRTGDELLECKNFGVTSLTEVREKLTAANLKLRGD